MFAAGANRKIAPVRIFLTIICATPIGLFIPSAFLFFYVECSLKKG